MANKKTEDVFFEIVLKNSADILNEAHYQRVNQEHHLHRKKSNDHTADAALDNIFGGSMTIDSNGELRRLRNIQAWAKIIGQLRMGYQLQKDQLAFRVFQIVYMERRGNGAAIRMLRISREKLFAIKREIKNFVRGAAVEMGIWKLASSTSFAGPPSPEGKAIRKN